MSAAVLGNARKGGALRLAIEAVRRLRHCGEVALLLSNRGDVILLPHWSPQYTEALKRAQHLCGVYRMPVDPDAPAPVTAGAVCADMIERWRELNPATFARARDGALPTQGARPANAVAGRDGGLSAVLPQEARQ